MPPDVMGAIVEVTNRYKIMFCLADQGVGGAFACSDLSPWAVSSDLAYGFAGVNLVASNETAWCCSCYKYASWLPLIYRLTKHSLTFTSGPVTGKKMVVQVVNTGNDLGDDQFDLAIPGGGQGNLHGYASSKRAKLNLLTKRRCSAEFGGSNIWGQDYGGIAHREDCDVFPEPLKGGCYWRFDWFRNAGMFSLPRGIPNSNEEKITRRLHGRRRLVLSL
jgi:hypothetical protein